MNILKGAHYALKLSINLRLATPLLLRSGQIGDLTDSSIEKTPDQPDQPDQQHLLVNGYVWASLLRRSLSRLSGRQQLAEQIGKYQNKGGVSPLWCETTTSELHATAVNPGICIDRKWGTAKPGALFNDELAIAGLPLTLRCIVFTPDEVTATTWRVALLDALRLVHDGIENIGGGWTYGYGRLVVEDINYTILDLKVPERRKLLWRWEGFDWRKDALPAGQPKIVASATTIAVEAKIADGQLMAIKSSVFPLDASGFGKLPDTFVFRRNHLVEGIIHNSPVIPGKVIRQALLSSSLERKWRSQGGETAACLSTTHGKTHSEDERCKCRRCRWFGSTDAAGIIAVTDGHVINPSFQVVSRVQLCEHSMQNMNLFSGEYLTGGEFSFKIIIDENRANDASELLSEVTELLEEMKGESAPPGWYRMGSTASCTGQVQVNEYVITRSTIDE
ncbi:MAG: hypothetical protein J0665_18245 [Deltaproteobacteria bacterium]|nr:hypothetical protein [Deltaproteobacteria bacterium]